MKTSLELIELCKEKGVSDIIREVEALNEVPQMIFKLETSKIELEQLYNETYTNLQFINLLLIALKSNK